MNVNGFRIPSVDSNVTTTVNSSVGFALVDNMRAKFGKDATVISTNGRHYQLNDLKTADRGKILKFTEAIASGHYAIESASGKITLSHKLKALHQHVNSPEAKSALKTDNVFQKIHPLFLEKIKNREVRVMTAEESAEIHNLALSTLKQIQEQQPKAPLNTHAWSVKVQPTVLLRPMATLPSTVDSQPSSRAGGRQLELSILEKSSEKKAKEQRRYQEMVETDIHIKDVFLSKQLQKSEIATAEQKKIVYSIT